MVIKNYIYGAGDIAVSIKVEGEVEVSEGDFSDYFLLAGKGGKWSMTITDLGNGDCTTPAISLSDEAEFRGDMIITTTDDGDSEKLVGFGGGPRADYIFEPWTVKCEGDTSLNMTPNFSVEAGGRGTLEELMDGKTFKVDHSPGDPIVSDIGTAKISLGGLSYYVHGTVKDIAGNLILGSKLALIDFEKISNELPLKKLSESKPEFEDQTTSDAKNARYEFRYDREAGKFDEKLLVVSLLWYDTKSEFAVTSGSEAGGRYIPVYLAQCVDNIGKNCAKWKKTDGGFEAELNFVYGSNVAKTFSFIELESWNPGASGSFDQLMAESALVYSNSYKAMKYFEGIMGSAGVSLNPVMIQVRAQIPDCNFAQYDAQAKLDRKYPSFGDLGKGLDKVESTGSSIRICDQRSATSWKDIPVGREWHELGHYLNYEMYLNFDNRRFVNHAGYANESTNDSLAEGFAEFVAMLINEHYGAAAPNNYPRKDGSVINLEEDYKVWGESVFTEAQPENGALKIITFPVASYHEEWAIAGILWDLHDNGNEVNPKHVIGQDGNGQNIWAATSKIYPDSADTVSLSSEQILQTIKNNEPKTLFALHDAFKNILSSQQLDMIFVNHGAFGDVAERNLVQDLSGEQAGPTGHTSERMVRGSDPPALPGSYLSTNGDAMLKIKLVHDEPFSNYDYSYILNMAANEPAYFEMPPSYYPSEALVDQVSSDGMTILSNVTVIDSHQYWDYIRKNPAPDGIFSAIQVSSDQLNTGPDGTPQAPSQPSGCLIATAAFGSEMTPQVQFLRDFRDNRILATASGSSFMTVFNAWYYSFSPQVADYERQEPWLQQSVRIAIYPLLAILQAAEKAYTVVPGEYGSVIAGLVTSSLIGVVYLTPIALSIRQVRNNRLDYKLAIAIITAISISIAGALVANNTLMLMASTSVLVIATLSFSAIFSAKAIWRVFRALQN
ncbi:MAG TPA: CFI-box-CTERM domain-containing protein [Anaerolineales bacterium]|nr:CFI-box-CTERM domain-containing protein [Anaerolineales bacterium]